MTDLDYAIMFVEEKFGAGSVFELIDYIEYKKRQEDEEK